MKNFFQCIIYSFISLWDCACVCVCDLIFCASYINISIHIGYWILISEVIVGGERIECKLPILSCLTYIVLFKAECFRCMCYAKVNSLRILTSKRMVDVGICLQVATLVTLKVISFFLSPNLNCCYLFLFCFFFCLHWYGPLLLRSKTQHRLWHFSFWPATYNWLPLYV